LKGSKADGTDVVSLGDRQILIELGICKYTIFNQKHGTIAQAYVVKAGCCTIRDFQ